MSPAAARTIPAGADPDELLAQGRSLLAAGRRAEAARAFQAAAQARENFTDAYFGWAEAAMPGPGYVEVLRHFHQRLRPRRYLEVGVEFGDSLALASDADIAVGVDPEAQVGEPPANARIFAQKSDDFFARRDVRALLGGPVDMGFVDGLHLFEQALADFANMERVAAPDAVLFIHDCMPLDAVTASRERTTRFWSGDVWKVLLCFRACRPDLRFFTIPANPTGLSVVTRLDPTSTVLHERRDELVDRFRDAELPDEAERRRLFNVVVNDPAAVDEALRRARQG
jgi:hypothetical protein